MPQTELPVTTPQVRLREAPAEMVDSGIVSGSVAAPRAATQVPAREQCRIVGLPMNLAKSRYMGRPMMSATGYATRSEKPK